MKNLYTIGHSNLPEGDFMQALGNYQVRCLVDVRSVPFSRFHPHFNQNRLRSSLAKNSIEYVFLGDKLGGRIADTSCYIGNQIPAIKTGIASYINYDILITKDWFRSGIQELENLVEQQVVAIMCSEEDPQKCHRQLIIARKLCSDGFEVFHIRTKAKQENLANELFE